MFFTIALGINSSNNNGVRTGVRESCDKKIKRQSSRKVELKISDEEVRKLRSLYEAGGITKRELYEQNCVGKITFNYMCMVVDYITRRYA